MKSECTQKKNWRRCLLEKLSLWDDADFEDFKEGVINK